MDEANYAKCSCPSCLNHVAFPTNLLGVVIDCPHCARPFKLELATASSQPATGLDLPTIQAAFQGKVEIRETLAQYKIAVVLVTVVMVLMVLVYLVIVAGGRRLFDLACDSPCVARVRPSERRLHSVSPVPDADSHFAAAGPLSAQTARRPA